MFVTVSSQHKGNDLARQETSAHQRQSEVDARLWSPGFVRFLGELCTKHSAEKALFYFGQGIVVSGYHILVIASERDFLTLEVRAINRPANHVCVQYHQVVSVQEERQQLDSGQIVYIY